MTAERAEPGPPGDEHRVCLERARRGLVLAGWQVDPDHRDERAAAAGTGHDHQLDGT